MVTYKSNTMIFNRRSIKFKFIPKTQKKIDKKIYPFDYNPSESPI